MASMQVGGAAIMQKEEALAEAPERRGTELVGTGRALMDAIRQAGAHVVQSEVGIGIVGDVGHAGEDGRSGGESGRVTEVAANGVELSGAV